MRFLKNCEVKSSECNRLIHQTTSRRKKCSFKKNLGTHVFVRNDTVMSPLWPPYDGPYVVLKRCKKYFKINIHNRTPKNSTDRVKAAFITLEEPVNDPLIQPQPQVTHPLKTRSGRHIKISQDYH